MKPENHPKKLIAIDLDGTLLDSGKHITERTKQVLKEASRCGAEPVIVTGRPLSGLPAELEDMPEIRYVITSNGAVTKDLHAGRILRSRLIPSETAMAISGIPDQHSWLYSVFIDGIGYCVEHTYRRLRSFFAGTPLDTYVRKSRRLTDNLPGQILDSAGIENIWIVCDSPEQADHFSRLVTGRWNLQIFRTAPEDIEIGAPEAGKGAALTDLYRSLHLLKEDVIAIGDNHNDLSMLKAAGTAVAMGNASEEILQMADVVTDTNDNDGVAKMIETLL